MWIIYTILFTICISPIIYFCWRKRREIILMSTLPGPSLFDSIKLVFRVTRSDNTQLFKIITDLFVTYGPVVSMWYGTIPLIYLKDPNHIEKFCKLDQGCKRLPEILAEKLMNPIFKGGVLVVEGEEWRKRRKILNNKLHINVLESFVDNFNKNSNILVTRLEECANGFFEPLEYMFSQLTMDIIAENLFCYSMNAQVNNDLGIVENFGKALELLARKLFNPFLYIPIIFKLVRADWIEASVVHYLHCAINRGIDVRFEEIESGRDLEEVEERKGDLFKALINCPELSRKDIVGEIGSQMGAGSESSSTACCYTLALLCENQDVQERIVEEQRRIFKNDMLCPVTSDHLTHMTYLEQVIKEILRLYPTVPYIYRSTDTEIEIDKGIIIPRGSVVVLSAFCVHRDEKNYPNPEQFDPERFSPENSVGRHPCAYIPFSHGRRMCVGHKFAMMELKIILSTVLRRYHFLEIEGGVRKMDESLQTGLVLKPLHDFKFRFLARKL